MSIAYDPFLSVERRAADLGVEKLELDEELLQRADFITLHVPLTDKTRDMINADAITQHEGQCPHHQLRPRRTGATRPISRRRNAIRARLAALPPSMCSKRNRLHESPLFGLPNVVCTPHLGASTTEAQENVALQIARADVGVPAASGAVANAINMPSITAEEAPRLKPFVKLAEVLGSFVGQVTESAIKEVDILYDGSAPRNMNTHALTSAVPWPGSLGHKLRMSTWFQRRSW